MSEFATPHVDAMEDPPSEPRAQDVVYTALFGQYEALNEEPFASESSAKFICFTDDPSLTSETWHVELVEPRFPMDPIRSARWVKIFGDDRIWRDHERSLWVDNRVSLRSEPQKILDTLLDERGMDVAMFQHSFRERVVDEFDAVVQGGYDDPARVYEQLMHYAESAPEVLEQRPLWTGFMARTHNDRLISAMQTWAAHVCRYSRRDQLSVNFALNDPRLSVLRLEGDNRESEWHTWPPLSAALNRSGKTRARAFEHSIRAPLARIREVERDQNDLLEAQAVSAAKRDKVIARQRTRTEELEAALREERKLRTQAETALIETKLRIVRLRERVMRLESARDSAGSDNAPQPASALRRRTGQVKRVAQRAVGKVRARRHG